MAAKKRRRMKVINSFSKLRGAAAAWEISPDLYSAPGRANPIARKTRAPVGNVPAQDRIGVALLHSGPLQQQCCRAGTYSSAHCNKSAAFSAGKQAAVNKRPLFGISGNGALPPQSAALFASAMYGRARGWVCIRAARASCFLRAPSRWNFLCASIAWFHR